MTNNNAFVFILCYCKSSNDTGKNTFVKKSIYVSINVTNKLIKCLLLSLNIVFSFFLIKLVILHLKCSVSSTVTKYEHCHCIRYCTI